MNKKNTKSENTDEKPIITETKPANNKQNQSKQNVNKQNNAKQTANKQNEAKSNIVKVVEKKANEVKESEPKHVEPKQENAKSNNSKHNNSKNKNNQNNSKSRDNKQSELKSNVIKNEIAVEKETSKPEVNVSTEKPIDVKPLEVKAVEAKATETKPIDVKVAETKIAEVRTVENKAPEVKHNNNNNYKQNNFKQNNHKQNNQKSNYNQNSGNQYSNATKANTQVETPQLKVANQSIKSMTGYSKTTLSDKSVTITVELRSLNGRNLELNCRLPRTLNHKEIEMREIVRGALSRGSVSLNVNIENEAGEQPFGINMKAAAEVYNSLNELKKNLKIKDAVKLDDVLQFATQFVQKVELTDDELHWTLVNKALIEGLQKLNAMRLKEGNNIQIDLENRVKSFHEVVKKIEVLGIERIPVERERIRQKITQLFENDDIDEQRLQTEIVLMADKLDISEECVRLHSHVKHFFEILKERNTIGQKLTFLLQEMHREINTIGSKVNDTSISHLVVSAKEEIERIREQVQNVE